MKTIVKERAIRLFIALVVVISSLTGSVAQDPPLKLKISPPTIPAGRARTIRSKPNQMLIYLGSNWKTRQRVRVLSSKNPGFSWQTIKQA